MYETQESYFIVFIIVFKIAEVALFWSLHSIAE